jgi:hypothetical protein
MIFYHHTEVTRSAALTPLPSRRVQYGSGLKAALLLLFRPLLPLVEPGCASAIPLCMKRLLVVVLVLLVGLSTVLLSRRPSKTQPDAPTNSVTAPPQVEEAETLVQSAARRSGQGWAPVPTPQTNEFASYGTNLIRRLLAGEEAPRITLEQANAFADANGRRADALLAAWRASGDLAFLREAMEKFPTDPHVAYMAWSRNGGAETTEEGVKARREWLERFKQAAPDNAVANYFAARERLKAGDVDAAFRELSAATDKQWHDYTLEGIQNTEEAYRASGFSEAESKTMANIGALLPHLAELRGLGKSLNELAAARRQDGDAQSADAAVQWALQVGERTGKEGSMTLVQEFVSLAIQRDALKVLDPVAVLGDSGQTVQQRLAALEEQRNAVRAVARESGEIMNQLSDADLGRYFDRLKLLGEKAAVDWAKGRVAR